MQMQSGFLDNSTNALFYILVPSQNKTNSLIVWFNGGPGCSSMDGMFLEIGPFFIAKDFSRIVNPYSWNNAAHILFIDQPFGTGFSRGSPVSSLPEAADHILSFFKLFFDIFPIYRSFDLYLSGESYAGTYIPYFANSIHETFPIKKLIIGNGWIDPKRQYVAYYEFAVFHNLISGSYLNKAKNQLDLCLDELSSGVIGTKNNQCELILNTITDASKQNGKYCINVYDIRLTDSGPNEGCGMAWPPGLETLKRYLNNPETKKSLNATNKYWEECSNSVPNALDRDTSPASISLLPSLLSKMEIVLFNGDMDYICNWLGIDYMIGNMTWADHTGFQNPSKYDWVIDGNSVGNYKKERNLTFIIVYNSSHMAPIDQGAAALDLVLGEIGQNRFGKLIDLNPPSNIKNITSIIDIDYAGYHSFFGYLLVIGGLFLIVYSCLWYRRRSSMGRGKHIIDGGVQWHELTNIDEEDGLFSGEIGWDEK